MAGNPMGSFWREGRIAAASLARPLMVAVAAALLLPVLAGAAVVRVEITERQVIPLSLEESPAGPYEILKGTIHLEVDPGNPANQRIADLALAPRNARGRVEFSTEIELHKPVDPRRGRGPRYVALVPQVDADE